MGRTAAPVAVVEFIPRRLCQMAVWLAAELMTVLAKFIGLTQAGPSTRHRRSNSEIVCILPNIVPSTSPTSLRVNASAVLCRGADGQWRIDSSQQAGMAQAAPRSLLPGTE